VSAPSKMAVKGQEEDEDLKGSLATKATTFQSHESEGTFHGPGLTLDQVIAPSCTYLESNKSRHNKLPGDLCCPRAVGMQISSRAPKPQYPGG